MNNRLTEAQMEKLLALLGYRQSPSNGAYRVFENAEFDTVQILPEAGREPYARVEHVMTLRRVSVEKGIVTTEAFNGLVEQVQQTDSHDSGSKQEVAAA